ncbi:hypothetical protein N7492_008231 [Penicillium capsulatum]|uniref:Uncharacterized protein n=1 Tax=Penicillium capsulatum TaxID=69766 RepID=A0A9W9LGR0_9EURO|nr:hypothetical protein N7492_008231 [Penicillium capsulatum]KAJ6105641.1 hypothetical protein N7512_009158 [Penicillium capsulatum]
MRVFELLVQLNYLLFISLPAAAIPTNHLRKRFDITDSCQPYKEAVQDAVNTQKPMGNAAADAIEQALGFQLSVPAERARKMVPRIFGIPIDGHSSELRQLEQQYRVIANAENRDIPIFCSPDILQEKNGEETYT